MPLTVYAHICAGCRLDTLGRRRAFNIIRIPVVKIFKNIPNIAHGGSVLTVTDPDFHRTYDYSTFTAVAPSLTIPASGAAVELGFDISIQYAYRGETYTYTGRVKSGDTLPDCADTIRVAAADQNGAVTVDSGISTTEISCGSRGTELGVRRKLTDALMYDIYMGDTAVAAGEISVYQAENTITSCSAVSRVLNRIVGVDRDKTSVQVPPPQVTVNYPVYSSGAHEDSVIVTNDRCYEMGFITGAEVTETWSDYYDGVYADSACRVRLLVNVYLPLAQDPWVYFGSASEDRRSVTVKFTYLIGGVSTNVKCIASRAATLFAKCYVSGFPDSTATRDAGTDTFYVYWYNKYWTISSSALWCTVSPASGGGVGSLSNTLSRIQITLTRTVNTTGAPRSATITLSSDSGTVSTHTYTQSHLQTVNPDIPIER